MAWLKMVWDKIWIRIQAVWLKIEAIVTDVVNVAHSFIEDMSSNRNRIIYGSILGMVIVFKIAQVWWLQLAALIGVVAIIYIDRKFYAVERPGS